MTSKYGWSSRLESRQVLIITFYATGRYVHGTWYTHLELAGTESAYRSSVAGPHDKPFTRWYYNGRWQSAPLQFVEPNWLNSAGNMEAAIREDAALVCIGQDGRRTQAILDAMYRSAYESYGGWVVVAAELEDSISMYKEFG